MGMGDQDKVLVAWSPTGQHYEFPNQCILSQVGVYPDMILDVDRT